MWHFKRILLYLEIMNLNKCSNMFMILYVFIHVILHLLKPITSREIDTTTEITILKIGNTSSNYGCSIAMLVFGGGRLASHELKPSQGVNFNLSFLLPGSLWVVGPGGLHSEKMGEEWGSSNRTHIWGIKLDAKMDGHFETFPVI